MSIGLGRFLNSLHVPCFSRGTFSRRDFPAADRSSGDVMWGPTIIVGLADPFLRFISKSHIEWDFVKGIQNACQLNLTWINQNPLGCINILKRWNAAGSNTPRRVCKRHRFILLQRMQIMERNRERDDNVIVLPQEFLEWSGLLRELRWLGMDHQAQRLELTIGALRLNQKGATPADLSYPDCKMRK